MKLPRVSDHAVLRYIERSKGVDVDGIRREIAKVTAPAIAAGASSLKIGNIKYVFNNAQDTVVSVVPAHGQPSNTQIKRLGKQ